jgi:hypothetical protein
MAAQRVYDFRNTSITSRKKIFEFVKKICIGFIIMGAAVGLLYPRYLKSCLKRQLSALETQVFASSWYADHVVWMSDFIPSSREKYGLIAIAC